MESEHGSGSSKHSETHLEVIDRSGSSRHLETHPEVIDESGNGKHFETYPEIIYGTGSSKHLEIHPEIIGESGTSEHSEAHPEVIHRSDSIKGLTIHPDATVNDGNLLAPIKKCRSSSSSSSSSDSSWEDLFQLDTNKVTESRACHPFFSCQPNEDAQPALKVDVFSNNSSKSDERDSESPGLTSMSPVSDVTNESIVHGVSPTQYPPMQVMDRSGAQGYDPYRIPSSVFERSKSTTLMEWSAASTESLFSIHLGNNSFSREHVFLLGGELCKSGELTKSGELIVFSPPPPIPVAEPDRKSVELKKFDAGDTIKDGTRANGEGRSEKLATLAVSWNSSRISHFRHHSHSHHSDGSGTSTHSFAFPINKKCAWPSCYCSNCNWAFCYCWNCSSKSCHCWTCSCKICHCWNCTWPRCRSCRCWNCTWPSCRSCHCWNSYMANLQF